MTRQEFDIFSESVRAKLLAAARSFGRFGAAGGDDPEDIVQEALTTLWGLYDSGYPAKYVEALAVKITKTVCVAHYRRRRLRNKGDRLQCRSIHFQRAYMRAPQARKRPM